LFNLTFINPKKVVMKKKQLPLVWAITIVLVTFLVSCNPQRPMDNIPFNEDSVRSHILPIQAAIGYTKNFRTIRDSLYKQLPAFQSALNLGQAEAFNRDALAVLLNQKDAQGNTASGVRVYYGLDRSGQVRMVLVPYDKNGNDIINQLIAEKSAAIPGIPRASAFAGNGQTVEDGQRCPVVCDNGSSGLTGGN
jgi:hypothetical protein